MLDPISIVEYLGEDLSSRYEIRRGDIDQVAAGLLAEEANRTDDRLEIKSGQQAITQGHGPIRTTRLLRSHYQEGISDGTDGVNDIALVYALAEDLMPLVLHTDP